MSPRRLPLSALLAAFFISLAGCGGGSENGGDTSSGSSGAAGAVAGRSGASGSAGRGGNAGASGGSGGASGGAGGSRAGATNGTTGTGGGTTGSGGANGDAAVESGATGGAVSTGAGGSNPDAGSDDASNDVSVDGVSGDANLDDVSVDASVEDTGSGEAGDGSSGPSCEGGLSACNGTCVDIASDKDHCGECNHACTAPKTCVGGCVCPQGQSDCGGSCVDTLTSGTHCGRCDNACSGGSSCVSGSCECPQGQTSCGGTCTNTSTDMNNCGACGTICSGGKVCTGTGCQCPQGKTDCGNGVCVETATDPFNCGACGTTCTGGKVCTGSCTCPSGQISCGGTCIDPTTDPLNCNGCNQPCSGGKVCTSVNGDAGPAIGACTCPQGKTDCGNGICIDTASSPANCGTCGHACVGIEVCSGGTCTANCAQGTSNCGGACVNLQTNNSNCGVCGRTCSGGKSCVAGSCQCPSFAIDCGGTCVDPSYDDQNCGTCNHVCQSPTACEGGSCSCPGGRALCGSTCIDTNWDNNNCGQCGMACGGGKLCNSGSCTCPFPLVDCGGTCVNPSTNSANCGMCGRSCGSGVCSAGACNCPAYQSYCGSTCIPTSNDPNNCGSCGHQCTAGQVCISATCAASCYGGLSACNGTCVDYKSDRNNCGSCGHACSANQGCANGSCVGNVVVGPPPAKCVNGGPPIIFGGSTGLCSGNAAATTFPWAVCTCTGFTGQGSQTFDAYDSTKAPYTPGGLGGGVGVNNAYSGGSSLSCSGTLWSYHDIDPGNASVSQELHVGGSLRGSVTVGDTGYVVTPAGTGTFNDDLHTRATCPPGGYTVNGQCTTEPGLTVPAPCKRCDPADQIPVQQYVTYYSNPANNDNAAIGLSQSVFNTAGAAGVLDLPCGVYYLDRIVATGGITIAAHGNTALFIGGSVEVKGALVLALDSTARFDLFVAGDFYGDGTLSIGSPAYPANMRVYVGGTCKAGGSSCVQNGECCSATCGSGTCGAGSILPNDPPWSVYIKASSNIAADIYAPNGVIYASASFQMYGAIFAGWYHGKASTTIHYDRGTLDQGNACPPPPSGCNSCLDCGNQACINGSCGACTNSSQCCPPLVCGAGKCILPT